MGRTPGAWDGAIEIWSRTYRDAHEQGRRDERERLVKMIRARQDQVDDSWKRFLVTTDYRTAVWALGDDLVAALEEPKDA